ncbi:MAG: porin family protein [Nitrospira sp.]|nr:porin family protein [Nitrospira sp.]
MGRVNRAFGVWIMAVGMLCLAFSGGPADAEMYSAAEMGVALPNSFSSIEGTGRNTGTTISNLNLENSMMYGLKFGYYLDSIKWLGFEAELFNSKPNIKQQSATAANATGAITGTVPGTSLRVLNLAPVNIVVRYQMGRMEPYAGVGMGIFMTNLKDGATGESSSNTRIGLNTQLGLRYRVNENVSLFGEWKYNRANLDFPGFTAIPAQSTGGGYKGDYSVHILAFGVAYHYD